MAAKSWEADFRYDAIQASIKLLEGDDRQNLFAIPRSFCIPVASKPIVGWTPGRITLISLVLGITLLVGAAYLASQSEKPGQQTSGVAVLITVCMGIAGIACFFAPVVFDRHIMSMLTGSRGAELRLQPGEMLCAEISDADRSKMKISIDGDDYVLLLADEHDNRLIVEGIAARYQIRGTDVVEINDFEFMNYIGAEIAVRIDDDVLLRIAVARVSMLFEVTRQLPFLFFLRKSIKNRILSVCTRTLWPDGQPRRHT